MSQVKRFLYCFAHKRVEGCIREDSEARHYCRHCEKKCAEYPYTNRPAPDFFEIFDCTEETNKGTIFILNDHLRAGLLSCFA